MGANPTISITIVGRECLHHNMSSMKHQLMRRKYIKFHSAHMEQSIVVMFSIQPNPTFTDLFDLNVYTQTGAT